MDSSHLWRPYDNEIVAIKTSVPGTISRVARHNSTRMSVGNRAVSYYDYSFGQVSPDGRYFPFQHQLETYTTVPQTVIASTRLC